MKHRSCHLTPAQLVEIYLETRASPGSYGAIYKGRVRRVVPGIQAAFVDIGLERNAFLFLGEDDRRLAGGVAEPEGVGLPSRPDPPRPGDRILVQVTKEAI